MKPITNITLNIKYYPEIIAVINELAKLEERHPHDTAKRLIVRAGRERIRMLKQQASQAAGGQNSGPADVNYGLDQTEAKSQARSAAC